jgi:integrase
MPRPSKGAHLVFRDDRGQWFIRDGDTRRSTGCARADRAGAEKALAAYLAGKYRPPFDGGPLLVADVLIAYLKTSEHRSDATVYAVEALSKWWGTKPVTDIRRATCQEYVAYRTSQPIRTAKDARAARRVKPTTAARELGVLRAALNAWHAERPMAALPVVTAPPTPPGRDRWLTRDEAARLLWGARKVEHADARRALIRFILIALYTGSRSGAIRALGWMPNTSGGWVDLERGVIHRRADGEAETKKRKPPVRIPRRLRVFLSRWREDDLAAGRAHVVSYRGEPVGAQRRSWHSAREAAGLGPEVTPHILRHTAATWMMHARLDAETAADYLGMSVQIFWSTYRHAHPDYQSEAADRIGRR